MYRLVGCMMSHLNITATWGGGRLLLLFQPYFADADTCVRNLPCQVTQAVSGRGAQTQFFSYSERFFLLHTFPETPDPEGNHKSTIKTAICWCHALWGPRPEHTVGLCPHQLLCGLFISSVSNLVDRTAAPGRVRSFPCRIPFLFLAETTTS